MPNVSRSGAGASWISPGMAAFAVVVISVALAMGTLSPKFDSANDIMVFPYADKVLHFLGWFVLGLAAGSVSRTSQWQMMAWVACSIFGVLTELGQILVVGRFFQWSDCLADIAGAAVGILVIGTEESDL